MKTILCLILSLCLFFLASFSVFAGDYDHIVLFKWPNPEVSDRVVLYRWIDTVDEDQTHWSVIWDSINNTVVPRYCIYCIVPFYFYRLDWLEFFAIQGLDKNGKQVFWDEFTHVRVPKGGG